MKQRSILSIALLISLFIHLILIFIIKDIVFIHPSNDKKVKLSLKRGGDISKDDSKLKENTQIIDRKMNFNNNTNVIKNFKSSDVKNNESDKVNKSIDISSFNIYSNTVRKHSNNSYVDKALSVISRDRRQEIVELYGDTLGDYGVAEIDFIVNNLREIGRITQYHFTRRGYPLDAAYLGQSGINIVEFYLHPNGDITDLKIIKDSKSHILDKNTLTTIKIAYKDYPRPSTKVKIIYSIKYFLIN